MTARSRVRAMRVMQGQATPRAIFELQGRCRVVCLSDHCKMTRWGLRSFTQAPCTGQRVVLWRQILSQNGS